MPSAGEYSGRVLVVDDDPTVREMLEGSLEDAGFVVTTAENLTALREAIKQRVYDAVLLDLFLGDEDGLEAIPFLVRESPYTKVIIMTAHGTIELAVNAMRKGASAFVSKSKNPDDLVAELKSRLKVQTTPLSDSIAAGMQDEAFGIIGSSPVMKDVMKKIEQFKNVDSIVLVSGESGTGKELIARAIHNASNRHTHRFEAINCGAIPENLLESELFGHKRGAFTDAKTDRKGIFELCSEGSLLLDEIGELPLLLQVKLLRVLQEKEVTPLGSGRTLKVNTRVIAATNRNLADEVRAGAFREDLYFRLAVLNIELPPLRDRRTDIPKLMKHFLRKMNERFNKSINSPSPELEARLMAYNWPGNIRELQNAIERGVVLSTDGDLHLEDMLQPMDRLSKADANNSNESSNSDLFTKSLSNAKQDFEKAYLKQLLEVTRGNISEMARISGRYRADIYRLLSKHGVEWEEFRPD